MSYPPQRPLAVGEILSLSQRIYRATLASCLTYATLGAISWQIPELYQVVSGKGLPAARSIDEMFTLLTDAGFVRAMWVGMALTAFFYFVVLLRQHRLLTGTGRGGEVGGVLRRLPALLATGILVSLACNLCLAPSMLLGGTAGGLAALVGLIPASYLLVAFSCAQTLVLTAEQASLESLKRSWQLTSGNIWRLSLVYTAASVILIGVLLLFGIIGGAFAAIAGAGNFGAGAAMIALTVVAAIALILPFVSAMALVVLTDLEGRHAAVG